MNEVLSVSIVAYNNYSDVCKAIESIQHHTSSEIEMNVFVIDNSCRAENDEERIHFETAISENGNITYVNTNKNLGFGRGHNYVLEQLHSEYHAIVNPDIEIHEDVFSSIISYMNSAPEVGMCIPRMVDQTGKQQMVCRRELTIADMFIRMFCSSFFPKRMSWHTMQDMNYENTFEVPFAQGSFLVCRTGLLQELKGFDDRFFMYLEDADLCKRVNLCSKVMYYPGCTVVHKWEKGSHKNMKLFSFHIQSMVKYFKKWGLKII